MRPQGYDYIVVGGGSAGCAVAARLSADGTRTVLLLEAGGGGRRPETMVPALYSRLFRSSADWAYRTAPQPELAGRRLFWPRGRMLGGCSAMNDMVHVRGNAADFDGWAAQGNPGWDHASLLPHFRTAEAQLWGPAGAEPGRWQAPRTRDFLAAAVAAGLTRNDDLNGVVQEGVGPHQVAQQAGRRRSAADVYLRPARDRANLTVLTRARVTGLVFCGERVVGVRWLRHGHTEHARATAEVVLCGGAVNTPALLLASGIGDAEELRRVGVPVRADLPGVGRGLQDHLMVPVCWRSVEPSSLLDGRRPGRIAEYLLRRSGPLSSNIGQAGGFVRSRPGLDAPDLQLVFAPVLLDGLRDERVVEPTEHGYSIGAVLLRPGSRGRISLRSADPLASPHIDPGYLTDPADLATLIRGVRLALRIGGTEPLARAARAVHPLADATDAEIGRFVRTNVDTMFHPVGTCRMGVDDLAVVDPALAVYGVEGLRVVDASVMPTITRGNTHAPTTVIAERAAQLVVDGDREPATASGGR
jgi:choline dehydrogenase